MPLIRTSKTIFIGKSCVHITVQLFELHVSSDGLYQMRYPPLSFIKKDNSENKGYCFSNQNVFIFSKRHQRLRLPVLHKKVKYYIRKYTSYTMMIRTFF